MGHAPKFVTIGNLGNDLLFVTIGSLGHALDFVTIGNLGNDKTVAKIANDFGWLHAFGDGEGEKPYSLAILAKLSCSSS